MLQVVAVSCRMLNCIAVCCSVCCIACCSILQCVAVRGIEVAVRHGLWCSALPCVAERCSMLQYVAVCCSMLQYVAVRCSMLQCVLHGVAVC